MKFLGTPIPGCFRVDGEPFKDARGVFRRHYCWTEFYQFGVCPYVSQCNVSENFAAFTLRGFHYQKGTHAEAKTISVLCGDAFVVCADLRHGSPTYLKWHAEELTKSNRAALHVPAGCAAAFLTLAPNTTLHYYSSAPYRPEAESGVRWDDPALGVQWPEKPLILSEKDANWPLLGSTVTGVTPSSNENQNVTVPGVTVETSGRAAS